MSAPTAATSEVVHLPLRRHALEYWENPKHRGESRQSSKRKKTVLCDESDASDCDDKEVGRPRTFQRTIPTGFATHDVASSDGSSDEAPSEPGNPMRTACSPIARVTMRRSPSGASHSSDSTLSSTGTRAEGGGLVSRVGPARHSPSSAGRSRPIVRTNWIENELGVLSSRLAPKSGACVPNSFA